MSLLDIVQALKRPRKRNRERDAEWHRLYYQANKVRLNKLQNERRARKRAK